MKTVSLLLLFILTSTLAWADDVGLRHVSIYPDSQRPLPATIWYPSNDQTPATLIADNAAFQGTYAKVNASPASGQYPLVLLSHGYRGNWRNLNWLATALVKHGYIVAAVDHPGTTTFNHDASTASQWWQRPKDISRLLDWLLASTVWQARIQANDISASGHSLGGWTVMQLAGAEVDAQSFITSCTIHRNPRVCGVGEELALNDANTLPAVQKQLRDSRIRRIASLDLGLAHSFSKASLAAIKTPTLILAAGVDIINLPEAEESRYLAKTMSARVATLKVYPDAAHFSFMQLCKPKAIALLNAEVPGDGIVCKDGGERSREALHAAILQDLLAFFGGHL